MRTVFSARAVIVLAGLAAFLPIPAHAAPPTGDPVEPPTTTTITTTTTRTTIMPGPPADARVGQVIQELNQANPFVQQSPLPPALAGQPSAGAPGAAISLSATQLGALRAILQNKWVQKYLRVLSDSDLQRNALALVKSPQCTSFFLWELGWILFMLVFKSWRMTKAKGFWGLLYTQLWTLCLFLGGIIYIIPRFVLGPAYLQFLESLIRAIRG